MIFLGKVIGAYDRCCTCAASHHLLTLWVFPWGLHGPKRALFVGAKQWYIASSFLEKGLFVRKERRFQIDRN